MLEPLDSPSIAKPRTENGATAVEYGLMVALIAVAILATMILLGGKINTLFQTVAGHL